MLVILAMGYNIQAQQLTAKDLLWKQIEARNKVFSEAFVAGNVPKMMVTYFKGATLMPEHSAARHSPNAIADFYKQWLAQAKVNSFKKTIYEVQDYGGYAIEIGTFIQNFTLKGGQPYNYIGKYMVVWRTSSQLDDALQIAAENWGANAPFNDKVLPQISGKDSSAQLQPAGNKALDAEVRSRNSLIGRLVTERKGAEHALLFLPDAIYMTNYAPMLVGTKNITPYFAEHEKPGTLKINKLAINTLSITEAKTVVIEYGNYSVDWSDGPQKSSVTGKSINVWKRDSTGTLMLYRQMVNHD